MNAKDYYAQLEDDFTSRISDVNQYHKLMNVKASDPVGGLYRRLLILILYAHSEGFCYFALTHYISAINAEEIERCDANPAIVAISINKHINEMINPKAKSKYYSAKLPDDNKLWALARRMEFMESIDEHLKQKVNISDDCINLESNIRPIVLRKALFSVGLDY